MKVSRATAKILDLVAGWCINYNYYVHTLNVITCFIYIRIIFWILDIVFMFSTAHGSPVPRISYNVGWCVY